MVYGKPHKLSTHVRSWTEIQTLKIRFDPSIHLDCLFIYGVYVIISGILFLLVFSSLIATSFALSPVIYA